MVVRFRQEKIEKDNTRVQKARKRREDKAEKERNPGRGRGSGRGRGRGAKKAKVSEGTPPEPESPKSTVVEVGTSPKKRALPPATPKQKAMIKRRRETVTATPEDVIPPSQPRPSPASKQKALCKANLQQMLDMDHLFVGHELPQVADARKSFTLSKPDTDTGSIGVILTTPSFYVYQVIEQNMSHVQSGYGYGEGIFRLDKKGGASLGWNRIGSMEKAFLDINPFFVLQELALEVIHLVFRTKVVLCEVLGRMGGYKRDR